MLPDRPDPHDLQRFVEAQREVYPRALAELRAGRKRTHWIWYILPQLAGLGTSSMSALYGIRSLDEARAYLDHPVLGPRLRECTAALVGLGQVAARDVLGDVDALKFRSSMTLFARVAELPSIFDRALDRFFGGRPDERTLTLLDRPQRGHAGREPPGE